MQSKGHRLAAKLNCLFHPSYQIRSALPNLGLTAVMTPVRCRPHWQRTDTG
jgi:hypothetical protein